MLCLLLLAASSCNPTKYVPSNETLLDENRIKVNREDIKKSELTPYIKQQPNKRIFGTRFYLGLYNLSNINKTRWPHGWLRQIGEAPVIFDISAADKTVDQIKSYVASKGYFDGKVQHQIENEDRKTKVLYNVNLASPYKIRNLYFDIADTNIAKLFYIDSVNSLIERGKPYDVDKLQKERTRFERYIRDRGFYGFSSEYISFDVDSTAGNRQVDIYYNIKSTTTFDKYNRITILPHAVYNVRNVYIYPDYIPRVALEEGESYFEKLDTTFYKGYYFVSSDKKPDIRYDLILEALYLKPGQHYNLTNTEQTQSHLLSLKTYRLVNINYQETNDEVDPETLYKGLNCNVQLTLLTPQSFRIELEGTNSSGNFGGALNLVYQHKNLFHGAELFSIKLKGAYEALKQESRLRSAEEYGFETSLRFPLFLIPFVKSESFIKKYNPSTNITVSYNYLATPWLTQTLASSAFGYSWKAGNYHSHIVNPLQLNFLKVPQDKIDQAFASYLEATQQWGNYKDVMILGGGYSFIYNNQKIQRSVDYWFLRINAETAGNMISLFENISGTRKVDGTYRFLNQPYAQYFKTDFDLRYNYIFNEVSSIVYRGFLGLGIPYSNSKAIPFIKQYFGGGANSIRAWQVRSLGPGSYAFPDSIPFPNMTGDIKIELNAEYRFKLFWILEGALFVDAGNIWTYNYDPTRPGTEFKLNTFLKDFAVGTGTGFRFDLDFVIARVDVGMKLRDPRLNEGWIIGRRPYRLNDFSLVLGIGYPF